MSSPADNGPWVVLDEPAGEAAAGHLHAASASTRRTAKTAMMETWTRTLE